MSSVILLIPFFLIRFGLLSTLNRGAVGRAAHFAPMQGQEQWAYWVYQLSTVGILVTVALQSIRWTPAWLFGLGLAVYVLGLAGCGASVVSFAAPADHGLRTRGAYRFSRNPMYVAYFVYFLGCVLLTQSLGLLGLVFLFQFSAHWIILAEERWCAEQFGGEYEQYKKRVRRYF